MSVGGSGTVSEPTSSCTGEWCLRNSSRAAAPVNVCWSVCVCARVWVCVHDRAQARQRGIGKGFVYKCRKKLPFHSTTDILTCSPIHLCSQVACYYTTAFTIDVLPVYL